MTGTLPTDFGFTGQRLDDTGLMFYHARYYAPRIGRFAQADTIVPDPANPQALNRYSYVNNRPLVYVDPSGHYATVEDNDYSLDDCLNNGGCIYPQGHDRAGHIILWTEEQKDRVARNRTVAGIITDLLPGIGDVKGLVEVFTGRDLATGDSLGGWRWLGIFGISELRPARHADKLGDVLRFADRTGADEIPEWLRNVVRGRRTEAEMLTKLGRDPNTPKAMISATVNGELVRTFPDYLDREAKLIGEIKDRAKVWGTQQIQAQLTYALENGYTYKLHVQKNTRVVPWLENAAKDSKWFDIIRDVVSAVD